MWPVGEEDVKQESWEIRTSFSQQLENQGVIGVEFEEVKGFKKRWGKYKNPKP